MLDQLYGSGAFASLVAAIHQVAPTATVVQSDTPSGVYIQASWGSELCRMDCQPTRVHFEYLSTSCNATPALRETSNATYKNVCNIVVPQLKQFGVQTVTAFPIDPSSTQTLLTAAGGFTRDPVTGLLTWVL